MNGLISRPYSSKRKGLVVVFVVIMMGVLFGMTALTIDIGMMYKAKQEAQDAADAAALAGAMELLDEDRLKGVPFMAEEIDAALQSIGHYAALNPVLNVDPVVPSSDVQFGYLHDLSIPDAPLSFADPNQVNTVVVCVRRDSVSNGPIDMLFATIFGHSTAEVRASGAASFKDGVVGYRVTPETGNAEILPLALHEDAWNGLLDGTWSTGDDWAFDELSETVGSGADQINELNLFPGAGALQLPPGNSGTVDIGSPDNSTADISRQIVFGINADDLGWFGGELALGPDGTLPLNGDTGLSAAIKDELTSIIGLPRAIPLFREVSGPGNNAIFTIVGFGGIRIMEVKLTGPMNKKKVIIQPAFVVDDSAITGPGSGSSYFVYQPVRIVR